MLLGQGELALAFGELLRKLWASEKMPVVPKLFKSKLARFAPQFSGFNQHDSQVGFCFALTISSFCEIHDPHCVFVLHLPR